MGAYPGHYGTCMIDTSTYIQVDTCKPWVQVLARIGSLGLGSVVENEVILFHSCSRCEGEVKHYHVWRDDRAWVTVDEVDYFENLFKLVEVYVKFNTTDPIPGQ